MKCKYKIVYFLFVHAHLCQAFSNTLCFVPDVKAMKHIFKIIGCKICLNKKNGNLVYNYKLLLLSERAARFQFTVSNVYNNIVDKTKHIHMYYINPFIGMAVYIQCGVFSNNYHPKTGAKK